MTTNEPATTPLACDLSQVPVCLSGMRWLGRDVEVGDFLAIRTYLDACMGVKLENTQWKWEESALIDSPMTLRALARALRRKLLTSGGNSVLEKDCPSISRIPPQPSLGSLWEMQRADPAKLPPKWKEYFAAISEYERRKALIDEWQLAFAALGYTTRKRVGFLESRIRKLMTQALTGPIIREEVLNWTVLPTGPSLGIRLKSHFEALAPKFRGKEYQHWRIDFLRELPMLHKVYIGSKSFDGYAVFYYLDSPSVALECPYKGNALYTIEGDWRTLSKLSKKDLLARHKQKVTKIIHDPEDHWKQRLKEALWPDDLWRSRFD